MDFIPCSNNTTFSEAISEVSERKKRKKGDKKKGGIEIFNIAKNDIERMITLTKKYSDLPIDLADCSLIIVAKKMAINEIISIDSDYDIYRTLKREPLINLLYEYTL